jgi:hydrogenase nickel incorporation protein HypB
MCKACGCSAAAHTKQSETTGSNRLDAKHDHEHDHEHDHAHPHSDGHTHRDDALDAHEQRISVGRRVLERNDQVADRNHAFFDQHGIRVLHLMSSPGAGKTLLLEKTLALASKDSPISVLVGDVEQDLDAQRLAAAGGRVKQLNTHGSCHLDAASIERELGHFVKPEKGLLIIENVGNLVCPAAFSLGEHAKVVLLSTPEGEDKPSKYPLIFHDASCIVITKTDLLPYVPFRKEQCESHIRAVNPKAPILWLSALTSDGMPQWMEYLQTI